jgi:hypothetical protein
MALNLTVCKLAIDLARAAARISLGRHMQVVRLSGAEDLGSSRRGSERYGVVIGHLPALFKIHY